MNSCYMLIKVGKGRCLMTTLLAKVYFSHFIFWGWWLWNKKLLFKFRYEKINLDSVPLLLIKLVWKNLLPSLFHFLKLEIWSCSWSIMQLYQQEWNKIKIQFTKSKFVQVIDPYHIMSLVFKSESDLWSTFTIPKHYQDNIYSNYNNCIFGTVQMSCT